MPGFNGSGPSGMGPMTGRGAGMCSGSNVKSGTMIWGPRGCGRGFSGRGFRGAGRNGFRNSTAVAGFAENQTMLNQNPDDEKQMLANQSQYLQSQLESIKARIEELEK